MGAAEWWPGTALRYSAAPRTMSLLGFAQAFASTNIQGEVLGSFRLVVTSASCSAMRRCDAVIGAHWSSLCWRSPDLPSAVSLLCKPVAVGAVLALAVAHVSCREECWQTWGC